MIVLLKNFSKQFFSGNATLLQHRITKDFLLNKVALDDNKKQKLVKCIKDKMNHKNFCLHLSLLKIFFSSSKDAMVYIDSCFLMISDTGDFLQLEVNLLEEILSRSSLFVTNEIEVYQAVDQWINCNFIEREKFSKRLLHKIRLPLLTEKTLKTILTKNRCLKKNKDSIAVVNDILKGNFDFYSNKPSKFLTARFCGHYSFEILYFGVEKITKVAGEIIDDEILRIKHSDDCKNPEMVSSFTGKHYGTKAVYLKGKVYIFGGFDDRHKIIKKVEMYSHFSKTCKVIANGDYDLVNYAVCGYVDKIYLFGGLDKIDNERDLCVEFDTKD